MKEALDIIQVMDLATSPGALHLLSSYSASVTKDPPWVNLSDASEVNVTTDGDPNQFPYYMRLLMSLVCGFILTVGLVGNFLVPIVIWNNRDLRNSTNLFLLNLSIADILVLCLCMPTALVEIHTQPDVWVMGEVMCKVVPFIELTVAHASVLTILAISFERYYVITRPLRAGYTCTRMRALLIICAIWIFGCISTSPMLFIAQYQDGSSASVKGSNATASPLGSPSGPSCITPAHEFWSMLYFVSVICIFFFLPLFILLVIYAIIARHLVAEPRTATRQRMQQLSTSENPNLRARRQVVAMLGTVVVFFFVCLLPFKVFTLWIIVAPDDLGISQETYYNALNFCRIMLYINSAINPILYNVMSSKFRSAFLKALGVTWKKKRLLRHLSRQSTFNTTTSGGTSSTITSGGSKKHPADEAVKSDHLKNVTSTKDYLFTSAQHGTSPLLHKYGRQVSFNGSLLQRQISRQSGDVASVKPLMTSSTARSVLRDSFV